MTQIATKNEVLTIVPAHYYLAIEERYKGTTYTKIKQKILEKYSLDLYESSIRRWFIKDGLLHEKYREYADEMIELEREETKDFLKGNVSKAAKILAQVMLGNGSPAQVSAANIFLDRGLGKVKEEIEAHVKHTGAIGVFDVLKLLEQQDL